MEGNIWVTYKTKSSVSFHFFSCYHIYVACCTNTAQPVLQNEALAVDHNILVVTIVSAKSLAHMLQPREPCKVKSWEAIYNNNRSIIATLFLYF